MLVSPKISVSAIKLSSLLEHVSLELHGYRADILAFVEHTDLKNKNRATPS